MFLRNTFYNDNHRTSAFRLVLRILAMLNIRCGTLILMLRLTWKLWILKLIRSMRGVICHSTRSYPKKRGKRKKKRKMMILILLIILYFSSKEQRCMHFYFKVKLVSSKTMKKYKITAQMLKFYYLKASF